MDLSESAEWQDLNSNRIQRDYVNGEGFLYLGRSYRLKLVSDLPEPLMLKDGYFCLRAAKGSAPDADAVVPRVLPVQRCPPNSSPSGIFSVKDRRNIKVHQDHGSQTPLGILLLPKAI